MSEYRIEHDSMGDVRVPAHAKWQAQTQRAVENFPISGLRIERALIGALAAIKGAAAMENGRLKVVPKDVAVAINEAAQEVMSGAWDDHFPVDGYQTGSGTSSNMNMNEVLATLAEERLGSDVHPNDAVNASQSSNDVFPSAIHVAATQEIARELIPALEHLAKVLRRKQRQFLDVVKAGRTHLMDATPVTLGQEFGGYAAAVEHGVERLQSILPRVGELPLGGTAVGTGITADPGYGAAVVRHLSEITGQPLETAPDLVEATSDTGVFMTFSSALKRSAIKLSKICNDLRLLSSGPQAGLGEINLPPRQAGSSIMPGKVNPVIPEAVSQVAYAVAGADVTVTMASESGQLQLNAFEPVIAHSLLQSITWMRQACWTLRVNCVDGITANTEFLEAQVASSVGVITALIPFIGYTEAAKLAKTALATGRPVADLVVEAGLMSREDVTRQLMPSRLSGVHPITQAIPVVERKGEPSE